MCDTCRDPTRTNASPLNASFFHFHTSLWTRAMSPLGLFLDYLWPSLSSYSMVVPQQRDSLDDLAFMNRHDLIQYSTQSLQVPTVVRHRTLRRKRAESVDCPHPQ